MTRVYLASGGAVSHAGRGLEAQAQGLDNPTIQPHFWTIGETTPAITVPYLPAALPDGDNRVMALIEAAVGDAVEPYSPTQREGMALFIASSTIDLLGREKGYIEAVARGEPVLSWEEPATGLLASRIAEKFGIAGPQYTINTACSSGVPALMYGHAMIRRGDCQRVLVVGLECPGRVTVAGFNSLLLATQSQCRPFDRNRDGLMIGEGAGAIVLDTQCDGPSFSGMELLGGAMACDTTSTTQNNPEAARTLITAAMAHAQVEQVDAVKAHGTGTPGNDIAEIAGIAACLDLDIVPVTSIKSVLGHTLGACGVLETLAMAACWRDGFLPPTAGFEEADPALDMMTPVTRSEAFERGRMLLNYFGFGGNNGAMVLEYAP